MIGKLKTLLNLFLGTEPKTIYKDALSRIELDGYSMNTLPILIASFWDGVKLSHFNPPLTGRQMMYTDISVRSRNISELCALLDTASDALIHDNHDVLVEISKEQLSTVHKITLDDYFADFSGNGISYTAGMIRIKESVSKHLEAIENITNTSHCRLLNRIYTDLYEVTWIIVNNMPEKEKS